MLAHFCITLHFNPFPLVHCFPSLVLTRDTFTSTTLIKMKESRFISATETNAISGLSNILNHKSLWYNVLSVVLFLMTLTLIIIISLWDDNAASLMRSFYINTHSKSHGTHGAPPNVSSVLSYRMLSGHFALTWPHYIQSLNLNIAAHSYIILFYFCFHEKLFRV